MLRIAIVDDDRSIHYLVEKIVNQTCNKAGILYDIFRYSSAENILLELQEKSIFDLILLDIEMPGMDGMALAARIRAGGDVSQIVFLTSYMKYVREGYSVNAFEYVQKLEMKERLPKVLLDVHQILKKEKEEVYTINTNTRFEKFYLRDICYIEKLKEKKYCMIATLTREYKERGSLSEILERMDYSYMVTVDRGVAVNVRYISQLKDGIVKLDNGISFPVYRTMMDKVRARINDYWGDSICGGS